MKKEKERLEELRRMTYAAYRETPEWQTTRQAAIKRAGGHCQGCKAQVALEVYHTRLDTLGCEQEDDIIALCAACYDHLEGQLAGAMSEAEEEALPHFSLGKRAAIFTPTALITMGLAALIHAPLPAEVGGLAVAVLLALNSPKIYAQFRDDLPEPLVDLLDGLAARKQERTAKREWNTWDRLLGRHYAAATLPNAQAPTEQIEKAPLQQTSGQKRLPQLVVLSPDLTLPLSDLAGKAIFVAGMRRSGKTTLGARIAEQLGAYHIPMLIPDKEGDYLSLAECLPRGVVFYGPKKSARDYGTQCYSYRVLPDWAEATGYAILEKGYQAILDLDSYATLDEAILVQTALIKGLFRWAEEHPKERTTCEVYLDEAQRYLPENLDNSVIKDKAVRNSLLDVYRDIIAVGGKRGLSPVVLSQRMAETNKKIIAQSELYFILRQTSDNDLDRVMEYVKKTVATREQIASFAKGEGVYIAVDGTQLLTRFFERESDGSRSHTPSPETAMRYSHMPMEKPDLALPPRSAAETQPAAQRAARPALPALSESTDTQATSRKLAGVTDQEARTDAASMDRPRPMPRRPMPRRSEEGAASLRHPRAELPSVLREALDAYEPGMTYRDLGAVLGYGDAEAREIWQELKNRGLLQPAAASAQERDAAGQRSHLRPLPRPATAEPERRVNAADLAKAFALWQSGASSVRKLEAAAKAAGYGWSNGFCRELIGEMRRKELIQQGEQEMGVL